MGPTGVGKTEIALELFQKMPIEILSVDSVQIYKHLNIGSGKPSPEVLRDFPHELINIIEPTDNYSTAKFQQDCLASITEGFKFNKLPILVGGTMMYFDHLINGISKLPSVEKNIRLEVEEEFRNIGSNEMHNLLKRIDINASKKIHPNDSQRIKRAIEVYRATGKEFSKWQSEQTKEVSPLIQETKVIQIALKPNDKEIHRESIANRFKDMIELGLVNEVEDLLNFPGVSKDSQSMKSVGYRQVCEFLEGDIGLDVMIEKAINSTRQLAKRQMTWINGWKGLTVLEKDSSTVRTLEKLVSESL
jgi:tRNA dimethylallyltransferase